MSGQSIWGIIMENMADWQLDNAMQGEFDPIYTSEPFIWKQDKTCRYCGKTGLHWKKFNNKWRLADKSNKKHICSN